MSPYVVPGIKIERASKSQLVDAVAAAYNVSPEDLKKRNRSREYLVPRQLSAWIMYRVMNTKLVEIGEELNQHHSTIIHSIAIIEKVLQTDRELRKQAARIISRLDYRFSLPKEIKRYKSLKVEKLKVRNIYSNTTPYGIAKER